MLISAQLKATKTWIDEEKQEKERITCRILLEDHSRDTIDLSSDRFPNYFLHDNAIGEHNEHKKYVQVNEL